MIRHFIGVAFWFLCPIAFAKSAADATVPHTVEVSPTVTRAAKQCGVLISVPHLKSVSDRLIGFGCTGSYKDGGQAVMEMDFQYDPNFNPRGGDSISFVIENIDLSRRMTAKRDSVFRFNPDHTLPVLNPDFSYKESNCGDGVVRTDVVPVRGDNWYGWIAEETFAKARGRCEPTKEYTYRYRCVTMTAQLDGVCLLRKRELSLENGFSYDLSWTC
jgi:hypothetical protein